MKKINLAANFKFKDLYDLKELIKLDHLFLEYLKQIDIDLFNQLLSARSNFSSWNKALSKLIISLAPLLENFIAEFFKIESQLEEAKSCYNVFNAIYECKRQFIQRNILKGNREIKRSIEEIRQDLSNIISKNIFQYDIEMFEQIFAEYILLWQNEQASDKLDIAREYALWACLTDEGKLKHKRGTLFKEIVKIDFDHLFSLQTKFEDGIKKYSLEEELVHGRDGFKLTDKGCNVNFAVDQANYCIYCHNQAKDSCSKGLNENLKGCPLDEKISEMNFLKSKANIIGSLAVAVIDNPMLAATGHRICNDCMKSCIYQKQKPVDIPQVETRVLKDVLNLPWGFEIYSLLTRWNPLNIENYLPCQENGAKVLIAGMGPAGFTLAHYLLNQGHIIVGIDGLKIEPLDQKILNNPIENIEELFQELDERVVAGFGGVMEYGITNRWNKNFLLLIRLLLERRSNFKLFSGVRLGSNLTIEQAFELGFQHIALALGAGSPRLVNIANSFARGVRTASDFLMSLQLGMAYKQDSLTNLQLRMPVVVIGGGLTSLDAATESIAYYPMLVEKFANDYCKQELGEEENLIAQEFLNHHELFQQAKSSLDVIKNLGGVKIVYRNKIEKAPSYRMNHQELKSGLSEGVEFIEEFTPTRIILDKYKHVEAIEGNQIIDGEERLITIKARTILLAAGTVPNVILAEEESSYLKKEKGYFKVQENQFITYNDGKKSISFLGDLHPDYAGNVVKAMASSKKAYKIISSLLKKDAIDNNFFLTLSDLLVPVLKNVNRLTDNIVELVIRSPLSARNFKPGQFFRLQNYVSKDLPLMEPIALTGAKVEGDLISTIVLEMGRSSNLCSKLKIDEKLVLMGPTGTATEIVKNKKVMLVGGGLGNAVLFSIGQALKENNNEVLYFAGYRKLQDRYKISEIENASDQIIWSCDEAILEITRPDDFSFKGNIIESILAFAKINPEILLSIDHIIVIGSDKMMHAIKTARKDVLKPFLKKNHSAIASINSPMQCMMKEICGQCLQRHIDPISGEESYVFSCNNQDQEMDKVDFYHLEERLKQNRILERRVIQVLSAPSR